MLFYVTFTFICEKSKMNNMGLRLLEESLVIFKSSRKDKLSNTHHFLTHALLKSVVDKALLGAFSTPESF